MSSPPTFIADGDDLPVSAAALRDLLQAVLAKGVPFRFRANGWSMHPFIQHGDIVSIAPLGPVAARLGDVVAFARPESGRLVVHRVIGRACGGLLIQGDNHAPDGLIPVNAILGRVVRVERHGQGFALGLGRERAFLALLSRTGLLQFAWRAAWPLWLIRRKGLAWRNRITS